MLNIKSTNLTIVIHTEEEFDWSAGFFRTNNQVNHGDELTRFVEEILTTGVKVVLAMDYAFVDSEQGAEVINHFKKNKPTNLEFASHLHPWVNPPYDEPSIDGDEVDELYSYPGNLQRYLEEEKLKNLTNLIESKTGFRPRMYLAGRYGVGKNSYDILQSLGYDVDVSISPFANFVFQKGPDFSKYTNDEIKIGGIRCVPHTTGYISHVGVVSNYLNRCSEHLEKINRYFFGKVLLKILGVKRVRLSPEGFCYKEMIKLIRSLDSIGVKEFVYSFHSPSVKPGLTPYVKDESDLLVFKNDTMKILNRFS